MYNDAFTCLRSRDEQRLSLGPSVSLFLWDTNNRNTYLDPRITLPLESLPYCNNFTNIL